MTRTENQSRWRQHIADWRDSGLSQKAYCQQHDLKLSSFGYWRQRLRAGDDRLATGPTGPFLSLGRLTGATESAVRVSLPDGIRVEIPTELLEVALPPVLRLARSTD